jgi:predicted 3-demethylubiquinone-9 3-methyltransferase (glyoxalase superfamily)
MLWFDHQAEEAAEFYVSVFTARGGKEDTKILDVSRYGDAGPGTPGTVLTVRFVLEGQEFTALNGGPDYRFTEAVSFVVPCDTQAEVDQLWNALTADGGEESMCGWLKDKYGLSWQVTPNRLMELLGDPDPARSQAVMAAMLKMRKIEIDELERAAEAA